MTVTQRRNRPAADAPDQQQRTTIEPGIKVTCDFCHTEITNTVRFKCAVNECRDLDICALCFSEGKEGQGHQAWHDYMVEEPLTTPIFDPDWGADEEILLISGLITYGLGNWLEVAAYIGTRTKEDCERHYCQTFLGCTPEGQPYDREKDMAVPPHTAGGNGAANGEADGTANGTQNGGGADPERIQGQAEEAEESKRKRRYMPPMSRNIIFDPEEYQIRKKARIEEVRKPQALPAPSGPMVSAPTNHEVGGYMPGRLEFEHEVDNDAEVAVKDMEFGLVWKYGGDEQPAAKVTVAVVEEEEEEDDDDEDDSDEDEGENGNKNGKVKVKDKAKAKEKAKSEAVKEEKEEKKEDEMDVDGVETKPDITVTEADATNGSPKQSKDKGKDKEENPEETPTDDIEDEGELEVKLALLDIYFSKLDKREEAKELIFDRGLTDYKRIQAAERRKPKDEREIINRYKVFAKLQTALDFEVLTEGLVYEQILRKRIAELQEYRRMGVTTAAEAEVYEAAKITRAGYRTVAPRDRVDLVVSGSRVNAGQNRYLHGVVSTPPPGVRAGTVEISGRLPSAPGRRPPAPLNLANSQSLDLLSTDEQNLCSRLRVLPKPYLSIKEMYIRENERRHGGLKRRDARKMLKIDVTKSGGIFDFLVKQGYLRLSYDQNATAPQPGDVQPGKAGQVNGHGTGVSGDGTQRPATGLNITSMSPSRKMNGVSGLDGA